MKTSLREEAYHPERVGDDVIYVRPATGGDIAHWTRIFMSSCGLGSRGINPFLCRSLQSIESAGFGLNEVCHEKCHEGAT